MGKAVKFLLIIFVIGSYQVSAQDTTGEESQVQIVVENDNLELNVGDEAVINAKVVDSEGTTLADTLIFFSRNRRALSVTRDGHIKALKPGTYNVFIFKTQQNGNPRLRSQATVNVIYPPLDRIAFNTTPEQLYEGTSIQLEARVYDKLDFHREDLEVDNITSSNPEVAEVDKFGKLRAKSPGSFTITALIEDVTTEWSSEVIANPVTSVDLSVNSDVVRTGDVINITAVPKDQNGNVVQDAPVTYSFTAQPDDDRGPAAPAQIEQDGRFVANKSGLYTIMAKNASTISETTVRVNPRNVSQKIEVVGHGEVTDVPTSDLWVWEGVDGKDYAVTGTHVGRGEAFFWDVSDPENMVTIDTVTVDARVVNDVKVSEDGRIAVISREGASNRKNGLVILDVTDPANVKILSRFDDGLTGGVHNVFIYEDHVYAINNGRRYDIINIEDPENPYRVSKFELDTPGHSVHDVWIEDGVAYSSNWTDGVVAVDVGSNMSGEMQGAGGSPENPKKLGSFTYPSGWNHAAFPFKSQSTDDFYVIAGDETFPDGIPAGWIHFFKLNSWEEAEEVARYEVPEAGTHNLWVKDDVLYVAYYQGGLRIVDISGELMGNLYDQGREIAKFLPKAGEGRSPNSPMAWGPQPYKDLIFVADMNSGLWALKLQPVEETASAE
ncbi:MAG: hypothetical protein FH748_03465 [Balneolaceae bacterium]|nr:hypothetical protein [Balneolaceae bacterium]